jgi:hypothetical protein
MFRFAMKNEDRRIVSKRVLHTQFFTVNLNMPIIELHKNEILQEDSQILMSFFARVIHVLDITDYLENRKIHP